MEPLSKELNYLAKGITLLPQDWDYYRAIVIRLANTSVNLERKETI